MRQSRRHPATWIAVVFFAIMAGAAVMSVATSFHNPATARGPLQSALPTPVSQPATTATAEFPAKSGRDIVFTPVPPGTDPDVLTEPIVITKRSSPRGELAVDGDYVVWRSYEDNQTNVVAYDLRSGEERRISSLPGGKSSLRISDRYVVWTETLDDPDVYPVSIRAYDLASGKDMSVSSAGGDPDVSGKLVVWNESRNPQDPIETDIYGYDLERTEEFPVVVGPGRHMFPRISDGWVIYLDLPPEIGLLTPALGYMTIHAHSILTGEDINLGLVTYRNDAWSHRRHFISGHMVAWRGTDGATHVYDLAARRERVLKDLTWYDDLVLEGRYFAIGGRLFNIETGEMLDPFRVQEAVPFGPVPHIDGVATDGRTLAWVFNSDDEEGRIYVARYVRWP